ncbi:MAG: InlB B-repeat-containing protein [Thermoleophilaceae bacterium]
MTPKRRLAALLLPLIVCCVAVLGTAAQASASPGALKMLIIEAKCSDSDANADTLRTQTLAQPGVAAVDFFDGGSGTGTPTASELAAYDLVLAMSNCTWGDPALIGDRLADYQDQGGVVVGATFNWQTGFEIGGRWVTDGYSPFTGPVSDSFTDTTMIIDAPGHPLLAGVSSIASHYQDAVGVAAGATQLGHWGTGEPAVAVKGAALGINSYLGDAYSAHPGLTGGADFGRLLVNAATVLGPHAVTVSRNGTGGGDVISDVGGINCGAACSTMRAYGKQVTLVATPDASSTFAGWGGDCAGSSPICVVTVDAAKNVTATFTAKPKTETETTAQNTTALFKVLAGRLSIDLATGKGNLPVRCNNVAADQCALSLVLKANSKASSAKLVKIGTAKGTIAGGKAGTLKVKLTKRGLALLRSARGHRLTAQVTFSSKNRAGKATTASKKLTLKGKGRPKR